MGTVIKTIAFPKVNFHQEVALTGIAMIVDIAHPFPWQW